MEPPFPSQGYDKDHPDIALLRLRNFTLGRKLSDEEVVAPDFAEKLKDLMGVLHPFVSCCIFLRGGEGRG